jgi:phage baseplate assembly protein W
MLDATDALTGTVDGFERVQQAIEVILRTRKGTRVQRRDFGSDIIGMIDRPMNEFTIMDAIMSIVEPIHKWEPEFRVKRVRVEEASSGGNLALAIEGVYTPQNKKAAIDIVV